MHRPSENTREFETHNGERTVEVELGETELSGICAKRPGGSGGGVYLGRALDGHSTVGCSSFLFNFLENGEHQHRIGLGRVGRRRVLHTGSRRMVTMAQREKLREKVDDSPSRDGAPWRACFSWPSACRSTYMGHYLASPSAFLGEHPAGHKVAPERETLLDGMAKLYSS